MAEGDKQRRIKEIRDKARAKAWLEWNEAVELAAADQEAVIASALSVYMMATSSASSLLERINNDVLVSTERIMAPAISVLNQAVAASDKIRAELLPPAQEAYKAATDAATTDWKNTLSAAESLYTDQLGAARRRRDAELDKANHLE